MKDTFPFEVVFTHITPEPSPWYPTVEGLNLGPAWRIQATFNSRPGKLGKTRATFAMAFGRKRDAEAAMHALIANGLTSRDSILDVGRERFEQVMAEAMAW